MLAMYHIEVRPLLGTAVASESSSRGVGYGSAVAFCTCGPAVRQRPVLTSCVRLREHDRLARVHRNRAATDPDFAGSYRQHRPAVERSIAWIVRGNRRLRYRGVTANDSWLHLRVTAVNLRRLTNLGLHHTDTTWALA